MGALAKFWSQLSPLQRKRLGFAFAALVLLSGATVVGITGVPRGAHGGTWTDPASILASRSPGARPAGALFMIKKKRLATALQARRPGAGRTERVLPMSRVRPAGAPLPELGSAFQSVAPMGEIGPLPGDELLGFAPPFGEGGFGGVPDVPAPRGSPPQSLNPGSPVPEPATWTMMVVAIAAMGARLRRSRAVRSDRNLPESG